LVAEKWTHLLQKEFAHQGEMESAVGMETTLFGGPPELGNMLKLANGQIGFMTIFAHPLFANVADIIPAMRFAADEILTNKGVWFTRAEHEKRLQVLHKQGGGLTDSGAVSPRTQSPAGRKSTPDHTVFPSSPLRERANSQDNERLFDQAERRRGRGSETRTPQDNSRGSSLAAVAAIPVSGDNITPTRSPSAKANPNAESRRKSGLVNGEHISKFSSFDGEQSLDSSSTPRLATPKPEMSDESEKSLNDTRRDNAVSMRAGTEALPVGVLQDEKSREDSAQALSKFNFATSDEDEPVRTFNPQRNYAAPYADTRASAPTGNTEHQNPKVVGADDARQTQSEEATNVTLRGASGNDTLTPVQSTEASSYASEKSEEYSRIKRSFQAMRNRAASAPLSPGSPIMRPSFSMGSNSATSRESSKIDVHATILSNGEVDESGNRDRKGSTRSVGRRRSKLKLGLAFWKRSKSEKSVGVDERPDSQGSGGR
jgi:3',5'-cyclic-nucleotide phosphodiesterase